MPSTAADIASQFMRQFAQESGVLVYRRHGKGAAYRVTEQETADFLARYTRRTRLHRLALVLATVALGVGGALLIDAVRWQPGDAVLAASIIGAVLVLVAAFVWLEMRSLTLPDRVLAARRAPISSALDAREWSRAQLAKAPWINFLIVPLVGFYLPWALNDQVDVMHGWGRLVWLFPLGFVLLAGIQGWRKWRSAPGR